MSAAIDCVIVGGLRVDTLISPAGVVYAGQIGGNAAFAAAGARLWDARPGLVARVGENYPAEWLAAFDQAGIVTRGVVRLRGAHDVRTFYAYRTLEERDDRDPAAHFARLGRPLPAELAGYDCSTGGQERLDSWAPLAVRPADLPPEYAGVRAAHIAPCHVRSQLELPSALRQIGVRLITLDPSERLMLPGQAATLAAVLGRVDVFLPSEAEVRAALPGVELWAAAERLAALGPRVVVIKIGARGQLVYERASGRRWHVPAVPARVVDVTGAGDAFCGGFLAGYLATGDPLAAAQRGGLAAARVIGGVGALFAVWKKAEETTDAHR
jgi:ribokinase